MFPGVFHYPNAAGSPLQRVPDYQQTSVPIVLPLVIPKPECFNALLCQKLFPCFIPLNSLRQTMLKAVEFDIQLRVGAVKIQDMSTHHVLSAKFESRELSSSQCPPKLFFFISLAAPKLAGDLFETHAGMMQVVGKISSSSPRPSPRLARRGS